MLSLASNLWRNHQKLAAWMLELFERREHVSEECAGSPMPQTFPSTKHVGGILHTITLW
jgi:hypothetical protein